MKPRWQKAAEYVGISVTDHQVSQMDRYSQWLMNEGVQAGGVGPNEIDRIDGRHLADSVLFAGELGVPGEVWDLGSGVGLPGIPLAILLPETEFTLIDRSGRRIDLAKRVTRILQLQNCQVLQAEIADLNGTVDGIVSRASLPPVELRHIVERHLAAGGVGVAGGSWREIPHHDGWSTKEIPGWVLDQPVWLLIMRRP